MMTPTIKACVSVFLLCSTFTISFALPLEQSWESVEDVTSRELLQGVKPCRWNRNYGSCDFNYDYVAQITPRTAAATAAKQWFANAKVCDSARYQTSAAICQGDSNRFCRWTGGTGAVKCVAVLQEYYNYLLACPGSVAKELYLCKNKFTVATCRANPKICRWFTPAGGAPFCAAIRVNSANTNLVKSASLPLFRQAWGTCPGSNVAFNQTICSKMATRPACVGNKYCAYAVYSSGPVCYTNAVYSPLFLYQNDPSFNYLLKRCNQPTVAACEGPAAQALKLDG